MMLNLKMISTYYLNKYIISKLCYFNKVNTKEIKRQPGLPLLLIYYFTHLLITPPATVAQSQSTTTQRFS